MAYQLESQKHLVFHIIRNTRVYIEVRFLHLWIFHHTMNIRISKDDDVPSHCRRSSRIELYITIEPYRVVYSANNSTLYWFCSYCCIPTCSIHRHVRSRNSDALHCARTTCNYRREATIHKCMHVEKLLILSYCICRFALVIVDTLYIECNVILVRCIRCKWW